MSDGGHEAFLQWALPRLHLRVRAYRRVRGQVCKRIDRRHAALRLPSLAAYRRRLEEDPAEWAVLDGLCRVTVSRFGRDADVWAVLVERVLPALAAEAAEAGRASVRAWSAGCGAGEEPYSLVIAWQAAIAPRTPGVGLDVLATDLHPGQLARASAAVYPRATLRELPPAWRALAFDAVDDDEAHLQLRAPFRAAVRFLPHDVRDPAPAHDLDLVLCRNLAFTYLDEDSQRATAAHLRDALRPGGFLVVGKGEEPPPTDGLDAWAPAIYRRESAARTT